MKEKMDGGDIELSDKLSDNGLLSNLESSSNFPAPTSVNTINELLRNTRTCTHTHTCNSPSPDAAHTHTCYHTHTQVIASEEDDRPDDKEQTNTRLKRPSGNREAVRKYREKKKAHTTFLEEEVKKLRLLNHQLVRKLRRQALLKAEVLRLRSILVDLKGKIDNKLGVFPYRKQCTYSTFREGDTSVLSTGRGIGLQCQTNLPCFHPHAGSSSQVPICGNGNSVVPLEGNCEPAIVDCQVNTNNVDSTEGQTVGKVDKLVSYASQPK